MKDLCKTVNPPPSPGFEYIATWWHKSFSKLKKIVLSFTNKLFQSFTWEGMHPLYFPPPSMLHHHGPAPPFLKIPILIWLYYILCNSGGYWMNICRKYYLGSIQNYWKYRRDALYIYITPRREMLLPEVSCILVAWMNSWNVWTVYCL